MVSSGKPDGEAFVSQLAEEADSKSVQCGSESHRRHSGMVAQWRGVIPLPFAYSV